MKIGILAANTGNGHISVMNALRKEFNCQGVKDVKCFPLFYEDMMISNKILSRFYNFLMINSPALCEKYCEFTYINRGDLSEEFYLGVKDYVENFLQENKFDILISVSHTINYALIRIIKEMKMDHVMDYLIVITDPYEPIAVGYAVTGAQRYYCANEIVKKILIKSHVEDKRILVSGYPVDSKFEKQQLNKSDILRKMQFNEKKKIVLINAGSQGINLYYNILKTIIKDNLQIIFICGKNEILYHRCQNYVKKMKLESCVKIFPFVENLHEYLYVSDLVITKAGANSIYESLIMEKPILIEAIEGFLFQEKGIQQLIIQYQFGEILENLDCLNKKVLYMLEDQRIELYRKQIRTMNVQNGCKNIVHDVIKMKKERFITQ